jgi:hypothetical protein
MGEQPPPQSILKVVEPVHREVYSLNLSTSLIGATSSVNIRISMINISSIMSLNDHTTEFLRV